ncbi:MAG: HAD hydrolase-like protein [Prevotella sp.]|nr:HAD hydrolase-like protein [Prevotella sp.]
MTNTFGTAVARYVEKHGFEQFSPKAVLFDMDGVIYDSMPNHAYSWVEAMKQVGLVMEPEDAYKYEGMRGVETIKLLARQQWHRDISDHQAAQYYAIKTCIFASRPQAPKMDGVELLMQRIKAVGLQIGVVTGSGQATLLDKLESDFPNLIHRRYVISSTDVQRGKPAPDPYLKGLQRLGSLSPWEAIVVENAPFGVRAAQAARIFTIAVNTGPLPDYMLTDEGADLLFPRMTDVVEAVDSLLRP